jgi:hypothetical protein
VIEDALKPREAIAGARLRSPSYGGAWPSRDRLAQNREVAPGPGLDSQLFQVAAQGDETPAVAGLGQNALVGRYTAGADTEPDEATAVGGREPDKAGATVGSGEWVVWVDEPAERDAVLLFGGGQGVRVAGNLSIGLSSK